MPRSWLGWCLVILVTSLGGCGRSDAPVQPPRESHRGMDDDERMRSAEQMAAADMGARSRPLQPGAAGAVEATLEAFRNGRLELVYDFLPAEFQQDVSGLVHAFAENVDPELWQMITDVLHKAVEVLREKRGIFVPLLTRPGMSAQEMAAAWDAFVEAADRLVHGPTFDREELKKLDVREALRMDLSRFTRRLMVLSSLANPPEHNPLQQLDMVQVDLVEANEQTARVRIIPREGENVEPTTFVKRDGKWIPQSFAEAWPAMIFAARDRIQNQQNPDAAAAVQQAKEQLRVVKQVLDQMLTTDNADQLAAAATPLLLQASEWSVPVAVPSPAVPGGPPEGVSILISRELPDEELTRLLRTLEELTDNPSLEYHLATANSGKTYISIKPVQDVAAFAAKLTFATDTTINADARTITVRDVRVP